tara:strand:+ start:5917 stop:6372 length:456 start_codon:yes stop_codon:yes gene_type:complete
MPDRVILTAAVTIDGYIARHNLEKVEWSKDLSLFKKQTMGSPVIMGSNTLKTISSELDGRDIVLVGRNDEPEATLKKIYSDNCFIIGGGKTYHRYIDHLTHIYVTPHPYVFGKGVPLFDGEINTEISLDFQNLIEVDRTQGIFQYQYKVKR